MLLSPRKNSLTSLFKEVRVFKEKLNVSGASLNNYNGLRGGSKPRKHPYLTTFVDIQGGMATQPRSLADIPQTPPKMAKL